MNITVPKQRNEEKWLQNKGKIKLMLEEKRRRQFNFKQYCEFSLLFIEANNLVFTGNEDKQKIDILVNPDLNLSVIIDEKKKEQGKKEEQTANRIKGLIAYGWKTIVDLIKGKPENKDNPLGIYTDENINLHFARLENMLRELKGKKYRCSVYVKDHAYTREMAEKEMDEELVFIKLLQSILQTQTKHIIDARLKGINRNQGEDFNQGQQQYQDVQQVQVVEEKLIDIREVVKVNEYFERKMAKMKEPINTTKDIIDQQHQKRRFNAAAVRFHFQHNHARR